MVEQDLLLDQLLWTQVAIESCSSELNLLTLIHSSYLVCLLTRFGLPRDDHTVVPRLRLHIVLIFESDTLFHNVKAAVRKFVINDHVPELGRVNSFFLCLHGYLSIRSEFIINFRLFERDLVLA